MKKLHHSYQKNNVPVLALLLCCMLTVSATGQDLHFSQFFETPLLRNPSLAGIFTGDYRIKGVYRDQWNSVTNAYKTASLSGEYKHHIGKSDDYATIGMQMLYDRAGTISWVSASVLPVLNFHKSLSGETNRYLSLGFMGGPVQRRIDVSKITTNSQYDGLGLGENLPSGQYTYIDASVGLSYMEQLNENPDNNMFAGLAYHHFTRPKNSFYRNQKIELTPKWVASTGFKFSVTEESFVTLLGDYSIQNKYQELTIGALYGIKLNQEVEHPIYTIHGGAFFRWNDAFIPVVKLDYRPFSVTLSYDVNISKLNISSYGRGGFEIGIAYIGFFDRSNSTLNTARCPRF